MATIQEIIMSGHWTTKQRESLQALAEALAEGGGGIESVNGDTVDNTDVLNPIIGVPTLQQVTDTEEGNETTKTLIIQGVQYKGGTGSLGIGDQVGVLPDYSTVIGQFALAVNYGTRLTVVGRSAGNNNTADFCTYIGESAGFGNTFDSVICLGNGNATTASAENQLVVNTNGMNVRVDTNISGGDKLYSLTMADGKLPSFGLVAPASATATGATGEIRCDGAFIYVCVATNTWVRSAIATW